MRTFRQSLLLQLLSETLWDDILPSSQKGLRQTAPNYALQRQTMTHKYANLWFWSHIATRSGHHIQLDQPDLVIAAIKQVLTGKV